jgi:hypothetical protein
LHSKKSLIGGKRKALLHHIGYAEAIDPLRLLSLRLTWIHQFEYC